MALPRLGLWAGSFRTLPIGRAQELAAEVESLGYGAAWFPESNARDVFVNLALLLGATDELLGGTAVATVWARDPLAMSTAANTLAEAFPDRVLLGLGISHQPLVEGMRGHTYDRPLATMRAYLDAMDAATYTAVAPASPARRLLAALGPKMLELAAERADGVLPYLAPAEQTARSREAVPHGLICPVQTVIVEKDETEARALAREAHLAFYLGLPNYANNLRRLGFGDDDLAGGGSDRLVDALVAWGSLDAIAERVQRHYDAGADHVIIQVISRTPEPPVEAWTELAAALT